MNKVLVTGASGMLGSNFSAALEESEYHLVRHTRFEADLLDANSTQDYIEKVNPSHVIHCAALVGGIQANIAGGKAFYEVNRLIDDNVLSSCRRLHISNLVYVSSSCMYPANSNRLLSISDIGREPLESTNRNYALAKIWGTRKVEKIAQETGLAWRTIVSSNLYGPHDHFDQLRGHLIASIISKVVRAKKMKLKSVDMWGDGTPRREFTYAPEFASWIVEKLDNLKSFPYILNVGYGVDFTVRQFYEMVVAMEYPDLQIVANVQMPKGVTNKLMDSSDAHKLGWNPAVSPEIGIARTLKWYKLKMQSND